MTTTATVERDLPLPPHELLARLADPDLCALRAASEPTLPGEVARLETWPVTPGEPAVDLTIRAALPESWVPSMARGRLPGNPAVVRRERWVTTGDGALATIGVTLEHVPATTVEVAGAITPAPGGSLLRYDLRLDVDLPLVGRAVERGVLGQVVRAYERECDVIADACR